MNVELVDENLGFEREFVKLSEEFKLFNLEKLEFLKRKFFFLGEKFLLVCDRCFGILLLWEVGVMG